MRFKSRTQSGQTAGFREALFSGLAPDGGLYCPAETPDLSELFASFDDSTPFQRLAGETCAALLSPEIDADRARAISANAFTFAPVLKALDDRMLLLELFHGPTCAFKDFGARFLAAAMEELLHEETGPIRILVATSGDTGSAVAHAFHGRRNIDVVILYPSGRVSELQEKQLTTLGGNVHALEVHGSFDDCQRLAKEAFQDPGLRGRLRLTSANSINVGRLLPQAFYYVFAATRRALLGGSHGAGAPTVCVPSGNFGNLTAGVLARTWGLPVHGFIAATNANDVVPLYLEAGRFIPRPSQKTLSNAMDVGNPSNFERLLEIFGDDWKRMAATIEGIAVSDARTLDTIREVHAAHGLFIDPHTAVGYAAAKDHLLRASAPAGRRTRCEQVIVLSTAHPGKFGQVVREATGVEPELPERLARSLSLPKNATEISGSFSEFSAFLTDTFA